VAAGPDMSDPIPDRIEVTFEMTAHDYARYFTIRGHESGWTNRLAYAGAFFSAIPVALIFRSIGVRLSSPAAADLIGQFSLWSFLLGAFAIIIAGSLMCRIAIRKYLAGTPNAFESKTAVLDATGVTLTGQISQAMWQWAAISRLSSEKQLLLIWIGQSPVVIPHRSFASDSACDAAKAFVRARLAEVRPA
jgi:hypothetical protein